MEVGEHSPYPKIQQRYKQGYLIQAHIPPLSNCKDTGEEPSSLHKSKHTHATRAQNTTHYSDGTTHSKQHCSKGVQPKALLARTITVALDMSKAFDTINIHTFIRKLLQTNIPGTIITFIAHYIKGRKAYTTYINHTSSIQNWRSTRWRPFTNTIQHIHCRHTTTRSTSSCHGLRR